MRWTVGALRPNGSGPISASPESLTTTRSNIGFSGALSVKVSSVSCRVRRADLSEKGRPARPPG